ncbi:MAG: FAD-binding FR-type protein [Campylobacterota bacterium]|nr:FAD-binding FR-type protein [Campylobacterota bacterium]
MNTQRPIPAVIKNIEHPSKYVKIFTLFPKEPLSFTPGQFLMVSVFPEGEAAFTPCSCIKEDGTFEIAINLVGRLTSKLHSMKVGDIIGIRGGYGKGFSIKKAVNSSNITIIAGGIGIAPLRFLIQELLKYHDRPHINIIYSANKASKFLFLEDLRSWQNEKEIDLYLAAVEVDAEWNGYIGRSTDMIEKLKNIDGSSSFFVCGPPPMFPHIIEKLKQFPVDEKNIFFTLERNMRCGIGKCGHCYMGDIRLCVDGPVMSISDIKKHHLVVFRECEPFMSRYRK